MDESSNCCHLLRAEVLETLGSIYFIDGFEACPSLLYLQVATAKLDEIPSLEDKDPVSELGSSGMSMA